jgi:F-type H+-transporting ATPase subunit gamma
MTARYDELAARIDSVGQIGSVVGALRGIAAAHVQRCRAGLAGVHTYAATVARAIANALSLLPAPPPPASGSGALALVLFCAEQGFAGAFSERVLDTAGDDIRHACLLLVGRRGQRAAAARGLQPAWSMPGIAHVGAAAGLADHIGAELSRRLAGGEVGRVEIIYTHPLDGSGLGVQRLSLFPLDLRHFGGKLQRPPPLLQLKPALLLERLALEYLRAQLTEAVLQNFAAENIARMLAMSAARDNIGRTLEELRREARIARQEAITAEVVELAVGTAAQ